MSEPTTISLLEQHAAKIATELKKSVGNDMEWREKQAEQWGFIRAHIESQASFNESTLRWQKEHQEKDDKNFDELNEKLDAKVLSVSSQVSGLSSDREKVITVWKAAAWAVGAISAMILALAWIGERIAALFVKTP